MCGLRPFQFLKLFPERLDLVLQPGDTFYMGILPLVFIERLDRRSPPDTRAHDLARQYPGLRPDHRAAQDPRVVAKTYLPADHAIVLDHRAARNAGLRGDDHPLADHHVVRDLHKVVDFGPLADPRFAQRAAVDAGVCADLDIVFDHDRAHLRKFYIPGFAVSHITEPVGPNNDTRMKNTIAADLHIVVNDAVRVDHRPFADYHVIPDPDTLMDLRRLADIGVFTNGYISADKIRANVRIFGNDGRLVQAVFRCIE